MLVKQGIDISFAEGLDTKTDSKRVKIGKFIALKNTVFQKGGLLQKRNGYGLLPALPDTTYSYLTTFNNNLTAIGSSIAALNSDGSRWIRKGSIQPVSLSTLPLIRNNLNQTTCDSAVASNGLVCTVYIENNAGTLTNKYVIADSVTGQNNTAPAIIPVASGTVSGGMRVFVLGSHFVMVFTNTIGGTAHLQYVAISTANPTLVGTNTDIAANYISATTLSWDGIVANNTLYLGYNTTAGGQQVKVTYLTSTLVLAPATSFATFKATMMSLAVDVTTAANPTIYASWYRLDTTVGYTAALDQSLNVVHAPTQIINGPTVLNLASVAQNGSCTIYYEVSNAYAFDSSIKTNYVSSISITRAGSVGSAGVVIRSVGLASKAFLVDGVTYFLGIYSSPYQPTYFLINGASTSSAPMVVAKLAYENGGGYLTKGLPGVTLTGTVAQIPYLFKDLIQAVNKNTNVPSGTQTAGIYSQTGINLVTFDIGTDGLNIAEIGNDLHITGGFLWMYDGYVPVEHNFFLYPDSIETSTMTGSGGITAQDYYYQVVYEWTDNQGNAFRSAPSIPVKQTTTTASSTNTISVPYLRLTMKSANLAKIVLYRWSTGQQNYYQVTSITSPTLNDPTADSVDVTDTSSDSTILGNNLLYTTGGVVEDVNAPASTAVALFDTRLWLIDAENPNNLWFSKQVIPSTPVEMSDLFTIFVPPTIGTETSTGPNRTIFPLDDKLIIGRSNALLYINGTGPDNTGANNQYSNPVFITSTVGCTNQRSWVLIPQGLVFQSDKGIWLLNRALETSYIGAPVEDFTTDATVLSAVNVPGTNQIRITLDSGITLMYDYYYDQWGTFYGVPCLSSCIFQSLHAFINSYGQAYQETVGHYLDGSSPVLVGYQTGPIRLGDLQGYQRVYFFYLLGQYYSPHKLMISITYDYDSAPSESVLLTPVNFSSAYGSGSSQSPYGQGDPYGGPSNIESWRVFLQRQRCMAFAITLQEIYDPTLGVAAGAGLTLSGINVVCGFKKPFRPQPAAISAGTS